MDTEEFHNRVTVIFRDAFAQCDFTTNPLEWEQIPQAFLNLMIDSMRDMLKQSREGCFGAPFHLDRGDWDSQHKHLPPPDANLKVELTPFPDAEMDWCGASFNLADAIVKDAEGADKGWDIAFAISQLEATIAKLKTEAEKRKWETRLSP